MKPRKAATPPTGPPSPPFKGCGECLSGWVTVFENRPGWTVPLPYVKRCWCWLHWREQLDAEKAS